MPKPPDRLDATLPTQLAPADKQVLDLLAYWPLCKPSQLVGMMGSVVRHRVNSVVRDLHRRSPVQRQPVGYVLPNSGLTYLARRHQATRISLPISMRHQIFESGVPRKIPRL